MSEVRLPLLRDAYVRHTPTTHPAANNLSGPIRKPRPLLVGSGRMEDQPDLLSWVGGGKAKAETSVLFLSNHTRGTWGVGYDT